MGDISYSEEDFGFKTIRNFYETLHAKWPQDGDGANVKHKADMAVIKRRYHSKCCRPVRVLRRKPSATCTKLIPIRKCKPQEKNLFLCRTD